jgi:hypothetical protein
MEADAIGLTEIPSGASAIIRTRDTDLTNIAPDVEDFGSHVLTCDLPESRFVSNGQQILSCLYNYSVQEWDGH